jgi:hypothetical protein
LRAVEISLNGKKLCVAGIGSDGVMTAIVNLVTRRGPAEFHLHVVGLISPSREHVSWIGNEPLKVGDEAQVKLVDATSVDEPKTKEQIDPAKDLRAPEKISSRSSERSLDGKIQKNPGKTQISRKGMKARRVEPYATAPAASAAGPSATTFPDPCAIAC